MEILTGRYFLMWSQGVKKCLFGKYIRLLFLLQKGVDTSLENCMKQNILNLELSMAVDELTPHYPDLLQ